MRFEPHFDLRPSLLLVTAALALALSPAAAPAFAQDNSECLGCHNTKGLKLEREGRDISLYVDEERFGASVHGGLDCVNCHIALDGTEEYPHATGIEPVDCSMCHDDDKGPIAMYWESTHGVEVKKGNALAPHCQDCHGNHYIIPLAERNSAISPFNIPAMCAQCHAEGAPVERAYDLPQEDVLGRYKESMHGEGLYKQGLVVTAVCTSCHTGHHVLPHTDERSTIHQANVVATCEKCHGQIEEVHRKVIAGELWEKEGIVPICVECHAPHEARRVFYDQNMSNRDCLSCHADPEKVPAGARPSLLVDVTDFNHSIHARKAVSCAQCHTGATPSLTRSCETIAEKVDCSICHEAMVLDYQGGTDQAGVMHNGGIHGKLHRIGDPNAPYCTDCHGDHGTLEHSVPEDAPPTIQALVRESPTFRRNVPELCARCHREGAPAAQRYLGPEEKVIERYTMSIHGKGLLQSGLTVTAICTDCHTPHKELPHTDPESTVSQMKIAETCGKCHDGIYEKYRRSIHSEEGNPEYVQLRGMPGLPHCNDCHSSHTMARTDVPEFKLGIMDQCGKCHQEVTKTYFDTYHGKASSLGDTTKAKCYDCHGAHNILPVTNPDSTLNRNHIVETCGRCHPGSHRQFAGYLTHATHHDPEKYPALFYAFWGMTILLVGTFSLFGLHMIAWLPRSWKLRRQYSREIAEMPVESGTKQYRRFPRFYRVLHFTVIVSFFGLALTGMTLKFSYTGWAQALSRILGGAESAGVIHRVCAVITFGYFFAHLWDVFRGFFASKKSIRGYFYGPDTILPKPHDAQELVATLKWFFGRGPMPRYGKWTYWEKFDYLAVFWGVAVIGSTGLTLWYPEFFTRFLPGWSINVATIIHSDEALLATGFIFTIHFFNTHFRPEKFPMDPVVFTGRMSLRELKHDRPRLYEQLVEKGELEKHLVDPFPDYARKAVKFFGFTALTVGLTLIVLIIYAMIFQYR